MMMMMMMMTIATDTDAAAAAADDDVDAAAAADDTDRGDDDDDACKDDSDTAEIGRTNVLLTELDEDADDDEGGELSEYPQLMPTIIQYDMDKCCDIWPIKKRGKNSWCND